MLRTLTISALILLAFYVAKTYSQRTGTSSKDRGGPEFQVSGYGTRMSGGPPNTGTGFVPSGGTGAKDRMGVMDQDQSNSQGQLDSRQSNLFAVNLTHALAVDQGIAAAGGGEESYINILR